MGEPLYVPVAREMVCALPLNILQNNISEFGASFCIKTNNFVDTIGGSSIIKGVCEGQVTK